MARLACMLVWGSGALALVLASRAHAGPTGTDSGSSDSSSGAGPTTDEPTTGTGTSDSGSSDSGSTSDSGTTTTGTTDTGSTGTTADDTTTTSTSATTAETGNCGNCDEGPAAVAFTTPSDESEIGSPVDVTVTVGPACSCDGCSCTEIPPMYTLLFLDSVGVGAPCYTLECAWVIDAALGGHTLHAATFDGDVELGSTTIHVEVTSVAPGTETSSGAEDGPPAGESSTGPASIGEDPPKGCGCATPIDSTGGALALVGLAAVRRRRRPRA